MVASLKELERVLLELEFGDRLADGRFVARRAARNDSRRLLRDLEFHHEGGPLEVERGVVAVAVRGDFRAEAEDPPGVRSLPRGVLGLACPRIARHDPFHRIAGHLRNRDGELGVDRGGPAGTLEHRIAGHLFRQVGGGDRLLGGGGERREGAEGDGENGEELREELVHDDSPWPVAG